MVSSAFLVFVGQHCWSVVKTSLILRASLSPVSPSIEPFLETRWSMVRMSHHLVASLRWLKAPLNLRACTILPRRHESQSSLFGLCVSWCSAIDLSLRSAGSGATGGGGGGGATSASSTWGACSSAGSRPFSSSSAAQVEMSLMTNDAALVVAPNLTRRL